MALNRRLWRVMRGMGRSVGASLRRSDRAQRDARERWSKPARRWKLGRRWRLWGPGRRRAARMATPQELRLPEAPSVEERSPKGPHAGSGPAGEEPSTRSGPHWLRITRRSTCRQPLIWSRWAELTAGSRRGAIEAVLGRSRPAGTRSSGGSAPRRGLSHAPQGACSRAPTLKGRGARRAFQRSSAALQRRARVSAGPASGHVALSLTLLRLYTTRGNKPPLREGILAWNSADCSRRWPRPLIQISMWTIKPSAWHNT